MKNAAPEAIWLFDGVCVLCSRGVQYTLRHEKEPSILFVAIQSEKGRALAQSHDLDPDDPTTFLFIENGIAFEKSDAVFALSQRLKGPVRHIAKFRFIPKVLRDAAYSLVARNRYSVFGKTPTCFLPREDQRDRFVL